MNVWKMGCGAMFFVLFGLSCKEESKIATDDLVGNWEVISAKRNGMTDRTLERGYIYIKAQDSLFSNFVGKPLGTTYILQNKTLTVHTNDKPIALEVTGISKDTISFASDIGFAELELLMVRK